MEVSIVTFPETRVVFIPHRGSPEGEHTTAGRLVAWKLAHGLRDPQLNRSYGLHYPNASQRPEDHRVDFCLSIDRAAPPLAPGMAEKQIPAQRCALARDVGSRLDNRAAAWLFEHWLPASSERPSGKPVIFHYVNVGPSVSAADAITDVYLPLREIPA